MSQWLSFFRDVVIRPLPNQAIENMDTEHEVVPQEPGHEDPIAIGPKVRYRKRMRVLPIAAKIPVPVSRADWGRYLPHMRYNCDQVPFNLDNSGRKTYVKAQTDVAVLFGQPGSEKRFGTLQVCLHAGLTTLQPPLTLIFRGAGPNKFTRKIPRYHPGVRVLWQRNAWMDKDLAVEWAKTVFIPFLEQKHPLDRQVLLLQDS